MQMSGIISPPLVGRWRESLVWFRTACAAVTSRVPAGGIIFHSFIFWKKGFFKQGQNQNFHFLFIPKVPKRQGSINGGDFFSKKIQKNLPPPFFRKLSWGSKGRGPSKESNFFRQFLSSSG